MQGIEQERRTDISAFMENQQKGISIKAYLFLSALLEKQKVRVTWIDFHATLIDCLSREFIRV
jgi:hypothetical protein